MATILVLDDEPSNLEVISAMLARRGHNVLTASTGADAVNICRTHPEAIDLVIADVFLRGSNAAAITREVAPLRPGVPFLYVSGTSKEVLDELLASEAGERPRARFLAKPFTTGQLISEVELLLQAPE
ncbi:MAG: response regulator [bacterium]|jgi:CheY-like chemotaxis protein